MLVVVLVAGALTKKREPIEARDNLGPCGCECEISQVFQNIASWTPAES